MKRHLRRRRWSAPVAAALLTAGVISAPLMAAAPPALAAAAPQISISGGHFINTQTGAVIQLAGVNRSGAEYACVEFGQFFDGETDTTAAINALLSWHVTAVRIPLNEDCWLGINGVNPAVSGQNYQNAIIHYVNDLNAAGIIAIPNLHFSAPGTTIPDGQSPMADQDHAPAFWTSMAQAFNNKPTSLGQDNTVNSPQSIIFDLFNEPNPAGGDTAANWQCIMQGSGTCGGSTYNVASMQEMLNNVRATGATQPVMTAGPEFAGILDQWLANRVTDPLNQVAASVHIYGLPLDSPDRTTYSTDLPPVAAHVPVVVGEFGDTDCTDGFTNPFLNWAWPNNTVGSNVSTIAWAWNIASCTGEPSLISGSYTSPVATAYGTGVQSKYVTLTTQGPPAQQAPVVTTNAATNVASTSATLNGSVNPEGASTTYQFDYGTTTAYGTSVPSPAGSAGSGTMAVNESANLTGLTRSTTYHYRIEATNATGTTFGADRTFTTTGGTCTIAEDASGPAAAHSGFGAGSVTSASFSPPANSLLEVEVNTLQSLAGGVTTSVTDSVNGTYTAGPHVEASQAPDGSWIYQRYLSSAPGSMTVTASQSGGNAGTIQLVVRVLTGAASSQAGAATATRDDTAWVTAQSSSISTTATGSRVYVVSGNGDATSSLTPLSNTSNTDVWLDSASGDAGATGKSSAATGTPGSVTLGWTSANQVQFSWAAQEVLAATTC